MEKNMDTNFDFNKTGKFNFDQVGKRMPYSTPEGFFKETCRETAEEANSDEGDMRGCNGSGSIGGSTLDTPHRFRCASFFSAISGR